MGGQLFSETDLIKIQNVLNGTPDKNLGVIFSRPSLSFRPIGTGLSAVRYPVGFVRNDILEFIQPYNKLNIGSTCLVVDMEGGGGGATATTNVTDEATGGVASVAQDQDLAGLPPKGLNVEGCTGADPDAARGVRFIPAFVSDTFERGPDKYNPHKLIAHCWSLPPIKDEEACRKAFDAETTTEFTLRRHRYVKGALPWTLCIM